MAESPARAMPSNSLEVRVEHLALGGRKVLGEIDLVCSPGTHTAILGPNGAGKTSLLKAIVGLLPFEGYARIAGVDLSRLPAPQRARRIAYVPQRSMLDSGLSVFEVVMMGRYAHGSGFGGDKPGHVEAVQRALRTTDTWELAQRSYLELSGGEQRRVLLARALATEATIIALDEPTAALDIAHSLDFFEQLRRLAAQGCIVLTILHDLRDAARFCDAALVLHQGAARYFGSATLPTDVVGEVYGVDIHENAARAFELRRHG